MSLPIKAASCVFLLAAACNSRHDALGQESASPAQKAAQQEELAPRANDQKGKPIADLPFSRGQTFAKLDDYLAHRRALGAIDLPYYEEVSPGRYRLEKGRGGQSEAPVYVTREELLREFGFRE